MGETSQEKALQDISTLYEISRTLVEIKNMPDAIQRVTELLAAILRFNRVIIITFDLDCRQVTGVYAGGEGKEFVISPSFGELWDGLSGWVLREGRPANSPKGLPDERESPEVQQRRADTNCGAIAVIPIVFHDEVMGTLTVINRPEQRDFEQDDVDLLMSVAGQIGATIANNRLYTSLMEEIEVRRQAEAEVQDLYDNAPIGYHSLDASGRFVMVNRTESNWLGYSREEMVGRPIRDFYTPASQATFDEDFAAFQRRGYTHDLDLEVIRKDGSTFPVQVNAIALYYDDGSFRATRSTMFDARERRTAEAQLRFQSNLLALISQAVTVRDPEGRIIYWNDGATAMFGWQRDEVMERPVMEVMRPEISTEQVKQILAAVEAHHGWSGELLVKRRDGSSLWVLALETPFYDEHGEYNGIISVSTDITQHKEAEEMTRRAALEMQRALRLKDEFLAAMSHELRTPLNGILTMSEVLADQIQGSLNEAQQRAIAAIESSGRHLLSLINDVLDLSKIVANKFELNLERVNVDQVCQASLVFARQTAQKKRIVLAYDNSELRTVIDADSRRLKQMLINLLSNAVKFTPEGGTVRLSVNTDPAQQVVRFAVEDTGIGIAAADLPKLFTPFTQLDSGLARQYEGTGLGLALVKNLAIEHGGDVSAESAGPGLGSRFAITLPYRPEPPKEPAGAAAQWAAPAAVSGRTSVPAQRTRSVLLVEDNAISAEVAAAYLEVQGYAITIARNGVEALERVHAQRPELMLLDIQLPLMDGLEVMRRLRSDPAYVELPIIVISALAMVGDREHCMEAGATEYMSKPLELKALSALMARILDG